MFQHIIPHLHLFDDRLFVNSFVGLHIDPIMHLHLPLVHQNNVIISKLIIILYIIIADLYIYLSTCIVPMADCLAETTTVYSLLGDSE